ncbi:MBL fold metallo-hydrolase [Aeromicrobium sp.]|uniref:MBL fold metallo-hydrolase n=1 Tax=Aeromicrobium sp. TaxID=1871063 RepID=UPI0030BF32ED
MTSSDTKEKPQAGPGMGRRALLTTAGGVALAGITAGAAAADPSSAGKRSPAKPGSATFEWLGNAGWRVSTPTTTMLVDPYLSRFDTGLAAGAFRATTPITLDTTAIDEVLGAPGTGGASVDAILVTHTHWDHFADVPHIATTRGATVYTSLSGYHLGQAMGIPASKLAVVKGSEELRVGDAVVRVVPSLHSRTGGGGLLFPGLRTQVPEPPKTIADMPEGDTLGFVIRRSGGGGGVLLLGASDYDDQALDGLDVDTVALPVPSNDVTVDYVGRLLRALELPRTVVLVHWDNFETVLRNPPRTDEATRRRMRAITAEIRRISPRTRVLEPTYLTPMRLL